MSKLEDLARKYAKPAYSAKLTVSDSCTVLESKFGGQPYFEGDSQWTCCTKCNSALFFICQVDIRQCTLASASQHFGLVQFFYCWNCYPWESEQPGWSVVNIPSPEAAKAKPVQMPPQPARGFLSKIFKRNPAQTTQCRIALLPFDSFPQLDDLEQLADNEAEFLQSDEIIDEYYGLIEKLSGRSDDYSTMVGGHAEWIQGSPNAKCKTCGQRMELLMQIGSEPEARLMFGDAGAAYIMYCSQHPHDVQLYTQCF